MRRSPACGGFKAYFEKYEHNKEPDLAVPQSAGGKNTKPQHASAAMGHPSGKGKDSCSVASSHMIKGTFLECFLCGFTGEDK